jgi:septal ring factor EnvC (AmiA/AmiB activator)
MTTPTTENIADDGQTPITNGMDLPAPREAVIEQAHRVHQEVCHERDELRKLVSELRTEIAGLKAMLNVSELQNTNLESRINTAMLVRDDKVAEAEQSKAVLRSIAAQLRAFNVEAEPLVRTKPEPVFDGS